MVKAIILPGYILLPAFFPPKVFPQRNVSKPILLANIHQDDQKNCEKKPKTAKKTPPNKKTPMEAYALCFLHLVIPLPATKVTYYTLTVVSYRYCGPFQTQQ